MNTDKVKNICVDPRSSVVKNNFLDCFATLAMTAKEELCDSLCPLWLRGSKSFYPPSIKKTQQLVLGSSCFGGCID
jgi:hypothetical protein